MRALLTRARALVAGGDAERARRCHAWASTRLSPDEEAELALFERAMRTEPGHGRTILGRARDRRGQPFWVGMPTDRLVVSHGWVTGGTGTGKTFGALAALLPILREGRHPIVYVDLKGELSSLLLDVVLPALAVSGRPELQDVRVIRPFDRDFVPRLRVTRPEEGVAREVQAMLLASQLQDGLGEDLGGRMLPIFLRLVSLAIELDQPLTEVPRWLSQPDLFVKAAMRSQSSEIREYASGRFQSENRLSVDALAARLDTFLYMPGTKLALSAPDCVSFAECLAGGTTVVDLGNPPAGAESLSRFWAGILVGRLARAILSRDVHARTPQAYVVFEEFQEALGPSQIEQFVRLLALARFKKCGCLYINQQPAQIGDRSPLLLKALRTNVNWLAIFRSNLEDARAVAHALPPSEDRGRSGKGRDALVEEITRLPDREFRLWLKQAPFRAQRVRSPRLDMEALRERAAAAPPAVREAIRRGTVALHRDEIRVPGGTFDDDRAEPTVPELLIPARAPSRADGVPAIG